MPSSEVLGKFKRGTLRSSSGQKVKNRKQAIAIMLSEQRAEAKHGGLYPERAAEDRHRSAVHRHILRLR